MTLHLTAAEWASIEAAGSGVLFREGECECRSCLYGNREHPPAEFVEAAQPCETCDMPDGLYAVEDDGVGSLIEHLRVAISRAKNDRCPGCLDGKRRVAVVVPCDHRRCQQGRILTTDRHGSVWSKCPRCRAGFVTVGHVVVTWGPHQLGCDMVTSTPGACVMCPPMTSAGRVYYVPGDAQSQYVTTVDNPRSLVGQYAIGVEVVR